jgi:hypothetical protein
MELNKSPLLGQAESAAASRPKFNYLPVVITRRSDLTAYAKLLFGVLVRRSWPNGVVPHVKRQTLADDIGGIKPDTITKLMAQLRGKKPKLIRFTWSRRAYKNIEILHHNPFVESSSRTSATKSPRIASDVQSSSNSLIHGLGQISESDPDEYPSQNDDSIDILPFTDRLDPFLVARIEALGYEWKHSNERAEAANQIAVLSFMDELGPCGLDFVLEKCERDSVKTPGRLFGYLIRGGLKPKELREIEQRAEDA